MVSFIAYLRKDQRSDDGLEFPDLPGRIDAAAGANRSRFPAEAAEMKSAS